MKLLGGEKNTTKLITITVALFFLIAKAISWKLWLANRSFPLIPLFDFLQIVPPFVNTILYCGSCILLLLVLIKPKQLALFPLLITIEILSCLLDQNRWQPWEYQYVFMFFVLWVNRKNSSVAIFMLVIILSSTYFYSGLQKINHHFIKDVWRDSILKDFLHFPDGIAQRTYILRLGYIIPLLEIILGISILIKRVRSIAIYFLLTTHIFILAFIGPWGLDYNIIVWPWNIALIIILIILLQQDINKPDLISLTFNKLNLLTLIVWGIFPVLNFWGYWDFYFSSSLYSARIDDCEIVLSNPDKNFELKRFYESKEPEDSVSDKETILLQEWALMELNSPPCPQLRVFKKIKTVWQKKYPNTEATFWFFDNTHKEVIKTKL